jgi:hypothetical protein
MNFYISNLPDNKFQETDGLVTGIEAFKAGTWRGVKYTPAHLQEMADNFKRLKEDGLLEPPMKVDHSESAKDVVGWVQNLYVDGDSLMADVLFTEQEAIEKVRRGTWRKVSSEIYSRYKEEANGKDYGMVFRALSIVSIPHLKNIKGIILNGEALEEEADEMKLEDFQNMLDEKLKSIEKDKVDFAEVSKSLMSEFKEFYAEVVQKYREEAELAKADAKKMAEAVKASAIKDEVTAYSESGKIVPAQADTLSKLLGTFSDEQAELFKKFMENSEAVELDTEHGEFAEDKSDKDLSPEEMAKKYLG